MRRRSGGRAETKRVDAGRRGGRAGRRPKAPKSLLFAEKVQTSFEVGKHNTHRDALTTMRVPNSLVPLDRVWELECAIRADYPENPGAEVCIRFHATSRCPVHDAGQRCLFAHPPDYVKLDPELGQPRCSICRGALPCSLHFPTLGTLINLPDTRVVEFPSVPKGLEPDAATPLPDGSLEATLRAFKAEQELLAMTPEAREKQQAKADAEAARAVEALDAEIARLMCGVGEIVAWRRDMLEATPGPGGVLMSGTTTVYAVIAEVLEHSYTLWVSHERSETRAVKMVKHTDVGKLHGLKVCVYGSGASVYAGTLMVDNETFLRALYAAETATLVGSISKRTLGIAACFMRLAHSAQRAARLDPTQVAQQERAVELANMALEINTRVLGRLHTSSAVAMVEVGVLLQQQIRLATIAALAEGGGGAQSGTPTSRRGGGKSPGGNTSASKSPRGGGGGSGLDSAARLLQSAKRVEALFVGALHLLQQTVGSEHPQFIRANRAMANLCIQLADSLVKADGGSGSAAVARRAGAHLTMAIPYLEHNLTVAERVNGARGRETGAALSELAGVFLEQGRHQLALPLLERAHGILCEHLDEGDLDLAATKAIYANALLARTPPGTDSAVKLLETALSVERAELPATSLRRAKTRQSLMIAYTMMQMHESAARLAKRLPNSAFSCTTLEAVSAKCLKLSWMDRAEDFIRSAVAMREVLVTKAYDSMTWQQQTLLRMGDPVDGQEIGRYRQRQIEALFSRQHFARVIAQQGRAQVARAAIAAAERARKFRKGSKAYLDAEAAAAAAAAAGPSKTKQAVQVLKKVLAAQSELQDVANIPSREVLNTLGQLLEIYTAEPVSPPLLARAKALLLEFVPYANVLSAKMFGDLAKCFRYAKLPYVILFVRIRTFAVSAAKELVSCSPSQCLSTRPPSHPPSFRSSITLPAGTRQS